MVERVFVTVVSAIVEVVVVVAAGRARSRSV